jgi:hypothetical protein
MSFLVSSLGSSYFIVSYLFVRLSCTFVVRPLYSPLSFCPLSLNFFFLPSPLPLLLSLVYISYAAVHFLLFMCVFVSLVDFVSFVSLVDLFCLCCANIRLKNSSIGFTRTRFLNDDEEDLVRFNVPPKVAGRVERELALYLVGKERF